MKTDEMWNFENDLVGRGWENRGLVGCPTWVRFFEGGSGLALVADDNGEGWFNCYIVSGDGDLTDEDGSIGGRGDLRAAVELLESTIRRRLEPIFAYLKTDLAVMA